MSQETINLIIGGIIGIVASLGATWLNFHFLELQENKKRNWELTDRRHIEKREIIKQRIEQTEIYVTKYLQFARDMIHYENEFIKSNDKSATVDNFTQTIAARMKDTEGLAFKPDTLKNQELTRKISTFRKLIADEAVYVANIQSRMNTSEFNNDVEFIRTMKVTSSIDDAYKEIIMILDEILVNQE